METLKHNKESEVFLTSVQSITANEEEKTSDAKFKIKHIGIARLDSFDRQVVQAADDQATIDINRRQVESERIRREDMKLRHLEARSTSRSNSAQKRLGLAKMDAKSTIENIYEMRDTY